MVGEESEDPFDGLRLDEAFVAAAVHQEASADERVRRPDPLPAPPPPRWSLRARRRRRRLSSAGRLTVASMAAFVLVVAGATAVDRSRSEGPVAVAPPWVGLEGAWMGEAPASPPTPGGATVRVEPAVDAEADGAHAFLQHQPGSDQPVAWDPCRPVRFVLSEEGLPAGAEDVLAAALAEVGRLTGLDLRLDGLTDETPTPDRAAVQPDRYGDRWAPVLVAWTDPGTVPELAGTVAGMAGGLAVPAPSGVRAYVTGTVLLDGPDLAAIGDRAGADGPRSVVLHELGHLVGLAHVEADEELMFPVGSDEVTGFGAGDRVGLARLGRGPCTPDL